MSHYADCEKQCVLGDSYLENLSKKNEKIHIWGIVVSRQKYKKIPVTGKKSYNGVEIWRFSELFLK
jgi:hypothetical protein